MKQQTPLAFFGIFGQWSESNTGTGWGVSFRVANHSGMWQGGSRSELGFVGAFIPCHTAAGQGRNCRQFAVFADLK